MIEFNLDSTQHLSILLFGGTLQETVREPFMSQIGSPEVFKTGQKKGEIKLHNVKKARRINGLGLKPLEVWKTKKEGIYSTDDETLSLISKGDGDAAKASKLMLEYRKVNKQISTYYNNILVLIHKKDNCIHPKFIHFETDTGRTSCKNPNVQNQPKNFESQVKQHFTSRFKGGKLIEMDFAQLEVAVEAQLSNDFNFINDVINGVDFHCKNLNFIYIDYKYEDIVRLCKEDDLWKKKRSNIKALTFSDQYGAGYNKKAEVSGLDVETVKKLEVEKFKTYPQLKLYHEYLKEKVEKQGYYQSITGRKYIFKKWPTPDWLQKKSILEQYKPTQIINYPTQGTATADIALIMLGMFWREKAQFKRDKYLLINTVHDSVLLDCKPEHVEEAKEDLHEIFLKIPAMMKEKFNYDWFVPIKIDIKVGDNWWEC